MLASWTIAALASIVLALLLRDRRRRREAAAPASARERAMAVLATHADDVLLLVDAQDRILEANDRAVATYGEPREALVGRPLRELRTPEAQARFDEDWRGFREGRAQVFETEHRRRDGTTFPVEASLAAAVLDGAPVVIAVIRDIALRRELQARLALADRMASLGTLAAGVAHEINDPLSYVVGNLAFAREALSAGAATPPEGLTQARQALDEANEGAARVRQIVGDLRALSRTGEDRREPVNVGAAVRSALNVAAGVLRPCAGVRLALAPVPPVLGDPARLGQVILNLLVNAGQAIGEGKADRNTITVTTAIELDGRVRVEVADTGPGIREELLPSIFNPFFTTKPPGQGTGLGLAICQQTVAAMGGQIEVRSRPGEGAVFAVLLPAAPVAVRPAAAPAPEGAGGPRGRVLVVDDEPYVGKTMRRILGASHDVEVLGSAEAALARLAQPPAPDVILCDLMMPGMTGMELHAALLARDPAAAARMVFVTGGALHDAARDFIARVANPVLEKPFPTDLLRGVVAETLRRGVAALPPGAPAAAPPG